METPQAEPQLQTSHEMINDVAYNFYGNRLATCSADRTIQVWDLVAPVDEDAKPQWKLSATLGAGSDTAARGVRDHEGPIYKVAWAHPEFGQVLASCSEDRRVLVWTESPSAEGGPAWASRAELVDARSAVMDVKFAPRQHGLKLAAASKDGHVRTYEAIDVMNLAQWTLEEDFEFGKSGGDGIPSLAWDPSRDVAQRMVVGSGGGGDAAALQVWQYSDDMRTWHSIAALVDRSGGDGGGRQPEEVRAVDWAPRMGRSRHFVACACSTKVLIWCIPVEQLEGEGEGEQGAEKAAEAVVVASPTSEDGQDVDGGESWRVSWNVTGTTLASSADDGTVKLWKANDIQDGPELSWECETLIRP